MNTIELSTMLNSDPVIKRFGPLVLAKDKFLLETDLRGQEQGVYIVNNDEKEKPGSHWVLVIFFKTQIIFFDSFAKHPSYYGMDQKIYSIRRHLIVNKMRLQSHHTNVCGQYCIFFSYFLCRGESLENILKHFSRTNFLCNDEAVYKYVQKIYIS